MTCIVINVVSVREGGSLVVLRQLLNAMCALRPAWQWLVVTNPFAVNQLPVLPQVDYTLVDTALIDGWRVRLWYETALPKLLAERQADLLYSQTNYVPSSPLPCPSLLLVQHAGHFSVLFNQLTEQQLPHFLAKLSWRLKKRWVRSSVERATQVTVQTTALATAIANTLPHTANKLQVIPHGPGLLAENRGAAQQPMSGSALRIGYITKAGVQKNFTVVLQALALLRQRGCNAVLVLTLDENLAANQAVLAEANALGIAHALENHGELAPPAVADLYASLHCFVFASLCESFGFPLVEAMTIGLPLCVANTPSNCEVAGPAAQVFEPHDANALAELLQNLTISRVWQQQAQLSRTQAQHFSWALAAQRNVALIEQLLVEREKQ